MTPELIEKFAREVWGYGLDPAEAGAMQRFAALVRAHVLDEAAKVCDDYAKEAWGFTEEQHAAQCLAIEIRKLKGPHE